MRLVLFSPRSNFIETEVVKAYHSAFFHGICGRDGEWYPHDTRGVDAQSENPSPLTIQYNRYALASLTWPGSWPVIRTELALALTNISTIRCRPIAIEKVIDQKWSVSEPIDIEPGNLSPKELYARFPSVDSRREPKRLELQTCRMRKIARAFESKTSLKLHFGTPPLLESEEVECCAEMFEAFPILAIAGSLIIERAVFDVFAPHVTPEFFNVREYEMK